MESCIYDDKNYLEEGGGADKLGGFIEQLHKRTTIYGYIVRGEWWNEIIIGANMGSELFLGKKGWYMI